MSIQTRIHMHNDQTTISSLSETDEEDDEEGTLLISFDNLVTEEKMNKKRGWVYYQSNSKFLAPNPEVESEINDSEERLITNKCRNSSTTKKRSTDFSLLKKKSQFQICKGRKYTK